VANRPAADARPATHHHWHVNVSIPEGWVRIGARAAGQEPMGSGQNLPLDTTARVWQDFAMLGGTEDKFSVTRAVLSTCRRAKSRVLSV